MTKKQIVKNIAEQCGLTQVQTKQIVQSLLDHITEALVQEERLELRDFGVFEVVERAPRWARNPRTGTPVHVPARRMVRFKPGKAMREQVRIVIEELDEAEPIYQEPKTFSREKMLV